MSLKLQSMRALVLSLLLLSFLGGCATTNPRDPLEPVNRAVYHFNDTVDNAVIRPIAQGYRAVLPSFVRTGVSNFFANIGDVLIALNNLLQGKVVNALSDVGRVLVNTTVGLAGFFDVATPFGMEKHNEDFGQTLGYWGVGNGPYLVLPILGPSTLRDTVGTFAGAKLDPVGYVRSMSLRNSLWGTRLLSQRADLLDTSRLLETASLDPYEFLRDAYLQRRRNLIYDGVPPREKFEDDDNANGKPRTAAPVPVFAGLNAAPKAAAEVVPEAGTTMLPTLPVEEQAPASARKTTLPSEPTAAGAPMKAQEPKPAAPSVVRVWVPAD
jgi:phospholipid-binding lipoprotein MlaA